MKALPRPAAWSPLALLLLSCLPACGSTRSPERGADAPLAAASDCRSRPERCNARDDDCDGIIDESADANCGGLAHASSSCVQGTCVIERCSEGYNNCNGMFFDGCETESSCEPAVMTGEPMGGMSAAPGERPDAGRQAPVGQAMQPAAAGHNSPVVDDADSGVPADAGMSAPHGEADAGAACAAERCDGKDNDCDTKVDEGTTCAACVDSAPTGQGAECDRCVCESCGEALAGCTGTMDDEWNMLCGDVLTCFGKSVQAGLCTGPDSDCFQNGDGPCAVEFRNAFRRGWACTADPVRTPCGGLTRVRLECYRSKCAAVCKA